jgi:hypothetical protein
MGVILCRIESDCPSVSKITSCKIMSLNPLPCAIHSPARARQTFAAKMEIVMSNQRQFAGGSQQPWHSLPEGMRTAKERRLNRNAAQQSLSKCESKSKSSQIKGLSDGCQIRIHRHHQSSPAPNRLEDGGRCRF